MSAQQHEPGDELWIIVVGSLASSSDPMECRCDRVSGVFRDQRSEGTGAIQSIGGVRAVDCSVAVIGSGESHGTDVAYQALIHLRGTLSVSIRRLVVDKRRQDRTKKQRLRRGGPPSVEE